MTSSLKSLEDELRAEMSKNALVRIKRGLSRDQTQEVSVVRSLEAKPVNKVLFPTNPPRDQTRFSSPVTAMEILSLSLTGLPPIVSMVRYTAVSKGFRHFCSFADISRMCKHWEDFFSRLYRTNLVRQIGK